MIFFSLLRYSVFALIQSKDTPVNSSWFRWFSSMACASLKNGITAFFAPTSKVKQTQHW